MVLSSREQHSKRRIVNRAIELVSPRSVRKTRSMPRLTSCSACFFPTISDNRPEFLRALRQVLRHIKEHLRTVVRGCLAHPSPCAPLRPRAYVLAIAKRRLASKRPSAARTSTLYPNPAAPACADVEFHGAVDRRRRNIRRSLGRLIDRKRRRANGRRSLNQMGSGIRSILQSPSRPIRSRDIRQNRKKHRRDSCRSPRPRRFGAVLRCAAKR